MNYLVLLGWSYDGTTEIFSKEDLLEKFTLERVSPSPATFDHKKLEWFNQHYINHILTLDDLTSRLIPFLAKAGLIDAKASNPESAEFAEVRAATALLKDRLKTLAEAPELMGYFLTDELPPYDAALLIPKKTEPAQALDGLKAALTAIESVDLNDEAATEAALRQVANDKGLKAGQLFMPIRVAVTGRTESPGLFETLRVIGKARVVARITQAISRLESAQP
jgi:glutamyl-tRNA synthetase